MNNQQQNLEVYLQEYCVLKEEQKSRIGFRDNLIYVNLAAVGGILSFALSKAENKYGLLVLPLVCLILGWTYLVNDQKISAIGKYIRETLRQKVSLEISGAEDKSQQPNFFYWEDYHRQNELFGHRFRKVQQCVIDELTFVGSGILGLLAFWNHLFQANWTVKVIWGLEVLFLIILGIEIIIYAIQSFNNQEF